jgi:hypothetical protein
MRPVRCWNDSETSIGASPPRLESETEFGVTVDGTPPERYPAEPASSGTARTISRMLDAR